MSSSKKYLKEELDTTQAELESDSELWEYAIPSEKESLRLSLNSLVSRSGESRKRKRIYLARKKQGILADPRRSMHARWLLVFSLLAAFNYFITSSVCIAWFWRDLGFDVLSPPIRSYSAPSGVEC